MLPGGARPTRPDHVRGWEQPGYCQSLWPSWYTPVTSLVASANERVSLLVKTCSWELIAKTDNSSEQSALQHPKGEPEAQRQAVLSSPETLRDAPLLSVRFGLRSKTQQRRASWLLAEETAVKTHTARLVIHSQFRLLQLGNPVLAASPKDADTVLPWPPSL